MSNHFPSKDLIHLPIDSQPFMVVFRVLVFFRSRSKNSRNLQWKTCRKSRWGLLQREGGDNPSFKIWLHKFWMNRYPKPKQSMGLVYLPTCTMKINQFHVGGFTIIHGILWEMVHATNMKPVWVAHAFLPTKSLLWRRSTPLTNWWCISSGLKTEVTTAR